MTDSPTVPTSLSCPNCGYPVPPSAVPGSLVRCTACGSTFSIPSSLTPEPDQGALLIGSDFTGPDIPGWEVFTFEKPATFEKFEERPEWQVTLPLDKDHVGRYLLCSPGILDDFDACVTLRFLSGDVENFRAGLMLRSGNDGYYDVAIDSSGRYRIGLYAKEKKEWSNLSPWSLHPSLHKNFGERNTLRALLHGDHFRVYLNGVLAMSLHDSAYSAGKIYVYASAWNKEMVLTVSNLQVREVIPS